MGADVAAFMCNEAETRLFSEVFPLLDELYVPDGFESPLNSTDCPTVMAYVLNNSTLTDVSRCRPGAASLPGGVPTRRRRYAWRPHARSCGSKAWPPPARR